MPYGKLRKCLCLFCILVAILIAVYLVLTASLYDTQDIMHIYTQDMHEDIASNSLGPYQQPKVLLDTGACQIIDIPLTNNFSHHLPPAKCDDTILKFFTLKKGILTVHTKKIYNYGKLGKHVVCEVQKILRHDDFKFNLSTVYVFTLPNNGEDVKKRVEYEYLKIQCFSRYGFAAVDKRLATEKVVRHLHQIPQSKVDMFVEISQKRFEQHVKNEYKDKEKQNEKHKIRPQDRLNILMIVFDSTSRLNGRRHLTSTFNYLREHMKVYEMFGYNKVGENTFPNLIPLLVGISRKELNKFWDWSKYADLVDFIWKEFHKAGYATFYGEDSDYMANFNMYSELGFKDPPARHYFRHNIRSIHHTYNVSRSQLCYGPEPMYTIVFDHLKDFALKYNAAGIPYFAHLMMSEVSHSSFNGLSRENPVLRSMLKELNEASALDNTLVMLLGDHGLRFGPYRRTWIYGRLEDYLPLMTLIFPKKFIKTYPIYANNMEENQWRLTSNYDVYKLMCDLSFSKDCQKKQKGISLFNPIPRNRTCADANIPAGFCACGSIYLLDETSSHVGVAAQSFVNKINSFTEAHRAVCGQLSLKHILSVYIQSSDSANIKTFCDGQSPCSNKIWSQLKSSHIDIIIAVQVSPNDAMYQTLVRYHTSLETYEIMAEISKTNLHKKADCIKSIDSQLVPYCDCQP